jgi:hypothetical protein
MWKEKNFEVTVVWDRINPLIQCRVELRDDTLVTALADEAEKDSVPL